MHQPARQTPGPLLVAAGLTVAFAACGGPAEFRTVTLVSGGDVLLERPANGQRPVHRVGGEAPFEHVTTLLSEADLAFVNLEEPLCGAPPPDLVGSSPARLYAGPERATDLARAGIDVVSLANNHALDCGASGLEATLEALAAARVHAVGAGGADRDPWSPLILDLEGARVAFLAATLVPPGWRDPGLVRLPLALATADEAGRWLARGVARARAEQAQLVIVSLHWGVEGAVVASAEQRRLARLLRRAGVDVILGHGPHRAQPVEDLGGTVVAYSLGNLLFDANTELARRGLVLEVTWLVEGSRVSLVAARLHHVEQRSPDEGPRVIASEPLEPQVTVE